METDSFGSSAVAVDQIHRQRSQSNRSKHDKQDQPHKSQHRDQIEDEADAVVQLSRALMAFGAGDIEAGIESHQLGAEFGYGYFCNTQGHPEEYCDDGEDDEGSCFVLESGFYLFGVAG